MLELQQYRGKRLTDLVVQLLRDPVPLRLLSGQRAGGAGRPFRLQPIEHRVEGADEATDAGLPGDHQPVTGAQQVDRGHGPGEPIQRPQADTQQRGIGHQHRRQPPVKISASVSTTGVDTVTGPSMSSTIAAASTAALSRKIRQNNDTLGRLLNQYAHPACLSRSMAVHR
ncbi:hypothetical protein [Dactylosporangium cerinum]